MSETIQDIIMVKRRHEQSLLRKANVVGVAVGYKKVGGSLTDKIAIIVYVKKKVPLNELAPWDVVPTSIEGYPTDVVEAEFKALSQPPRTSRIRPAVGGISVGHYKVTAGTITNIFRDAKSPGLPKVIVSNNHVIALSNPYGQAQKGDPIYQPGPYDGGTSQDTIGYLERWVNLSPTVNLVDGAVAIPISQDQVSEQHYDFGIITPPVVDPILGMRVQKGGRTTGLTEGTVTAIDWSGYVDYGFAFLYFKNQIAVENVFGFVRGGDSGSLAVKKNTSNPVGVVFAGSADGSIGVLNNFKVFSNLLATGMPCILQVQVTDKHDNPLKMVIVSIGSDVLVTDENGSATFLNIPRGQKVVLSCYHPEYEPKDVDIAIDEDVKRLKIALTKKTQYIPVALQQLYSGAYLGSLLSMFMFANVYIVPELAYAFKELKEALR